MYPSGGSSAHNATIQINGRNSDIISSNSNSPNGFPEYHLQKLFAHLDYKGSLLRLSSHPDEARHWIVSLLPLHLLSYYITTANENDLFEDHIDAHEHSEEEPPLLEVFSKLIEVYPAAATTPCHARGWLPLHYLSHMSTMRLRRKHIYCQLLQLLIQSSPTMVTVTTSDEQGFGPLHLLFSDPDDFPPRSFIDTLIRPSPRLVVTMPNFGGGTCAIDLFYSNFCLDTSGTFSWNASMVTRYLYSYPRNGRESQVYQNAIRWEIALMLFHAAYTNEPLVEGTRPYEEVHNDGDNHNGDSSRHVFRPLHALAGVPDTPLDLMEFGLKVHSQHILNVDQDGNTLLHVAANCDRDGRYDCRRIIQCILESDSNLAVISNACGAYPLTIALERRMEWHHGVQDICEAAPYVLSQQDPVTLLVPFMLAASTFVKKDNDFFLNWAALDNTWETLRADPSQIQSFSVA